MRRLIITFAVFLLGLSLVTTIVTRRLRETAIKLGRARHATALVLAGEDALCSSGRPMVYWMGDSTFMSKSHVVYPMIIQAETRSVLHHCMVHVPGLDYFNFYAMTSRALARHPDLVVSVADLRIFAPTRDDVVFRDQMAELPASELLRAIFLPLHSRDLTVPRLLLNRVVLGERARPDYFFSEGLRVMFQESRLWNALGPREPPLTGVHAMRRGMIRFLSTYNGEVSRNHPVVRMMAATVDRVTRAGARSLVVVVPIPYEVLSKVGLYDPETYRRRIDLLRRVVVEKGGVLLDLHAELHRKEFSDSSGHYNDLGVAHMVRVLKPAVVGLVYGDGHTPAADLGGF